MTHTYSIDHVVSTTESVNVEVAAKSEMTLVATDYDNAKGVVSSTYILASGETQYPSNVTYRVEQQTRSGEPIRRITVTFSTWCVDDDGAGVVTRKPLISTISFNVPANISIELGDMDDLIGNLFSFLYASVTTGARSTTWLQKLLYGVPQVV